MKTSNLFYSLICLLTFILSSCERESPSSGTDIYIPDDQFKVVGYLSGGFDQLDQLELDKLTYLNLAFANPDQQGNLVFGGGKVDIRSVVKRGHDHLRSIWSKLASA